METLPVKDDCNIPQLVGQFWSIGVETCWLVRVLLAGVRFDEQIGEIGDCV